jgi:hypothetical protein
MMTCEVTKVATGSSRDWVMEELVWRFMTRAEEEEEE